MKWTFENAPKLIALLSLSLVVLTTVHDWGYFVVIGPRFRTVQTTYDYITNAIDWLPSMAVLIVITSVLAFVMQLRFGIRAEGFRDRQWLLQSRRTLQTAIFTTLVSLVGLGYSLFQTYPSYLMYYVSAGTGLATSAILFAAAVSLRQLKPDIATNLLIFPIAIVIVGFAFVWGAAEANYAIKSSANVYKLKLRIGDAKSAVLLRTFEKGVLIFNADTKTAELIRWEQIDGLSHIIAFDNLRNGCRTLSWFCPQQVDP